VNQVTSASLRYPLSVFNKNSTLKQNITVVIIMIILTIPFRFLDPVPTYKYIISKQHTCFQGPLRECFGQVLPGFLITVHRLCAILMQSLIGSSGTLSGSIRGDRARWHVCDLFRIRACCEVGPTLSLKKPPGP